MTVYAVEASTMAEQAEILVQSNAMQDRVTVLHGRIEVSVLHMLYLWH